MRNLLVLIIILACSCAVTPPPTFEKEFELLTLDLTQYAEDNFLISPTAYGGDYVTLAYILVNGSDGAVYVQNADSTVTSRPSPFSFFIMSANSVHSAAWVKDRVDLQQVIEAAVTAAKRMGANGLVSVNWNSDVDVIRPPGGWESLYRGTIQLEGWAIKRSLE